MSSLVAEEPPKLTPLSSASNSSASLQDSDRMLDSTLVKESPLPMKAFPVESETGPVEYKRSISPSTPKRLEQLTSQMSFRISESPLLSATYYIGIDDDGSFSNLKLSEIESSVAELHKIASGIGATVDEVKVSPIPTSPSHAYAIVTVSKRHRSSPCDVFTENTSKSLRVAVCGNVDAGKSTLVGTLSSNELDDGRGRSRMMIMVHRHEITSGRTSTSSNHLVGFNETGNIIPSNKYNTAKKGPKKSEAEIAGLANRLVTFVDLCGHEKYLKTTVYGISSSMADYAMVLCNSRQPPTHMTAHHLNLVCGFNIPAVVVLTKSDGCPEDVMKSTTDEICCLLKSPEVRRRPFFVKTKEDVMTVLDKMHAIAPIIKTSCVTGEGLDLLKLLLHKLPRRRNHEKKMDRTFEFLIEEIFNVTGVGCVLSGFVNSGELTLGENIRIGPTHDGTYLDTVVKGIHVCRAPMENIRAGQNACLNVKLGTDEKKLLRKGQVAIGAKGIGGGKNKTSAPNAAVSNSSEGHLCCSEFMAEIVVLKGASTTIRKNYQAFLHILHIKQSARAVDFSLIDANGDIIKKDEKENSDTLSSRPNIVLRQGNRARVHFAFCSRPERIRVGMKIMFRDGLVRGAGVIKEVYPHKVGTAINQKKPK